MTELTELRKLSLGFRRVSSNFLNSDRDTANVNLVRLIRFIEENPFLHDAIHSITDSVRFDFKECFLFDDYGRSSISIPVDEKEHLKAQYDYAKYLMDGETGSVTNAAFRYTRSLNTEKLREFISDAFKPMIDYLIDAISAEMIVAESAKMAVPSVVQNIEYNYGTANAQGAGIIETTNNANFPAGEIIKLLDKIIPSLDYLTDVPEEEIESVKDDLESVMEQVQSANPKRSRLQKALNGMKKFMSEFSMKLAVTYATGAVSDIEWTELASKIEEAISALNIG